MSWTRHRIEPRVCAGRPSAGCLLPLGVTATLADVDNKLLPLAAAHQAGRAGAGAFPGKNFAGQLEFIGRVAEFTPRNVQTIGERVKRLFPMKVQLDTPAVNSAPGWLWM